MSAHSEESRSIRVRPPHPRGDGVVWNKDALETSAVAEARLVPSCMVGHSGDRPLGNSLYSPIVERRYLRADSTPYNWNQGVPILRPGSRTCLRGEALRPVPVAWCSRGRLARGFCDLPPIARLEHLTASLRRSGSRYLETSTARVVAAARLGPVPARPTVTDTRHSKVRCRLRPNGGSADGGGANASRYILIY